MIQFFFVCLLLAYFWYFYTTQFKRIEKPSTGSPSQPPSYNVNFNSTQSNHFRFLVNGKLVWEHTMSTDVYKFHQNKIIAIDPCHGLRNGTLLPANGEVLYEYLKKYPEVQNKLNFKEKSKFTVQEGHVFYFKCLKGSIEKLEMCPSGTILVNNVCQSINSCTDKPDGMLLPYRFVIQYIVCHQGKEIIKKCPNEHIFHHNRCEYMRSLNHICTLFPTESFKLDEFTRVECQKGKPIFFTCKTGTQFFENDICEPANCTGLPDNTQIPLPNQTMNPFYFSPGYMTCQKGKIDQTITCPQHWDEMLSNGDNLTFLPMVFDGTKCSVPTFCENVFSTDPDVMVPVHEFTKQVKNWSLSKLFDHAVGFSCENNIRKRKYLPVDSRISKRFKEENACQPSMPKRLPVYGDPKRFYDCNSKSLMQCPAATFFNGISCIKKPENAFTFYGLPMFKFDSLNFESWIKAFDYSKDLIVTQCNPPESKLISLYNICSHPDCSNYAFVSQIPDMAILLPSEQKAKCKFYENEKLLKKEPVDFKYHFWSQKMVEMDSEEDICRPGQKLKTGNIIWDTTLYATCHIQQPFVFCPSIHTEKIIKVDQYYACEPPKISNFKYYNFKKWTVFEQNEIKRILPLDSKEDTHIRINKGAKHALVPNDGLEITTQRINLSSDKPIIIDLRYRVTHPPNVAFDYNDPIQRQDIISTLDHGFLSKVQSFTTKPLNFPKYKPIRYIESFNHQMYV